MAILRRITPASAFRVALVVYGFLGLVIGAFCTLIAMFGARFLPPSRLPHIGQIGILAVIICPIIYGTVGGIAAAIGAAIYNVAAGWIGGLEVDLG